MTDKGAKNWFSDSNAVILANFRVLGVASPKSSVFFVACHSSAWTKLMSRFWLFFSTVIPQLNPKINNAETKIHFVNSALCSNFLLCHGYFSSNSVVFVFATFKCHVRASWVCRFVCLHIEARKVVSGKTLQAKCHLGKVTEIIPQDSQALLRIVRSLCKLFSYLIDQFEPNTLRAPD